MFGLVPFRFNNGENNRGLSINDMFNDFFNDDMLSEFNSSGSFKTDIKENPEGYVIHAELPGVNKEDINIDYNNNYLTISAIKNNEFEEKKDNYIRRERSYGSVSRGFYINNIDKNSVNGKFDNGVLSVELHKKDLISNNENKILIE
ncbi:Hsp20/alpha crystallin family protein [uncultured Clostridium sp.]|uniref:Hsp20/alpha crystallin family protein n=1 Tax=uncultured Clostridium sp. TaxID=59620 RepID=UPI00262CC33A|nr:Hsp20/alpha crystallin family protein [uncultured Clostridium sp.]